MLTILQIEIGWGSMRGKTIAMIKGLLAHGTVDDEILINLKKDQRKGVHKLIKTYEKKQQQKKEMAKKFAEMCHYENERYLQGETYVAGVDEAGRGPLAGPVVAAAVILPKDFTLLGLTDSKQLSKQMREYFYDMIVNQAIDYAVSVRSNQVIDDINIYEATKQVMIDSIQQLNQRPDHVLVDAMELHLPNMSCTSIIKGDQKSITIAAASIIAKVTRDQLMSDIHEKYPMYDFHSNMGYGTKHHLHMLTTYGITPYHRKSFGPVRDIMNQ